MEPVNLVGLTPGSWGAWVHGYGVGYQHGLEDGWRRCEEHLVSLQRWQHRRPTPGYGWEPHADKIRRIRTRQLEVAAVHEANAVPWPDEATLQ